MENEIRVCEACLSPCLCQDDSSIPEGGWQRSHSSPSSLLELFDHVTESEITLKNTGKVGFEFSVLTDLQSSPDNLLPGVPLIQPLSVSSPSPPTHEGHLMMVGGAQTQTCKPHPRGWDYAKHSLPGLWVWFFFFLIKTNKLSETRKINISKPFLHSLNNYLVCPPLARHCSGTRG